MKLTRRRFLTGSIVVGGYVLARGSEEAAVRAVEHTVEKWWETPVRPAPLTVKLPLSRASERQRRALRLLGKGKGLDDDILSRATITYTKKRRRWMERQGHGISIWPGWSATDIPMEEQPDEEFGRWAARELDMAALAGEPMFHKVGAVVKQKDGEDRDLVYTRLMVPTRNAVVSVTEKV